MNFFNQSTVVQEPKREFNISCYYFWFASYHFSCHFLKAYLLIVHFTACTTRIYLFYLLQLVATTRARCKHPAMICINLNFSRSPTAMKNRITGMVSYIKNNFYKIRVLIRSNNIFYNFCRFNILYKTTQSKMKFFNTNTSMFIEISWNYG